MYLTLIPFPLRRKGGTKPKTKTNRTKTKQIPKTHTHTQKKENKKMRTSTQIRKEGTHTTSDKGVRETLMQWF